MQVIQGGVVPIQVATELVVGDVEELKGGQVGDVNGATEVVACKGKVGEPVKC